MQVEISQQVQALNPNLRFVDAYPPHSERCALAFSEEPTSEMLCKAAENIATKFSSGSLAWEPVQTDGEMTFLAFRVVA